MRRTGTILILAMAVLVGGFVPGAAADDEPPTELPTVSIGATASSEKSHLESPGLPCGRPPNFWPWGYTGPCLLKFPVSVVPYPGSANPVQVTVAFSYGTADADDVEELPDPITLTFPGSSSQCACVTIADDLLGEPDETIIATITAVTGGVVDQASAVGTILDDDPAAAAPGHRPTMP